MSKRMTVIVKDDALSTALKVEEAQTGRHAKDIVADVVHEWLSAGDDEELLAGVDEARDEWAREGGVDYGAGNKHGHHR